MAENREKETPFARRLWLIIVTIILFMGSKSCPAEASFKKYVRKIYPNESEPAFSFIQMDNSMKQIPTKRKYQDFSIFAVGTTTYHKYRHYHLGVFGGWIPLPYLPRPGTGKHIGIGLCWKAQCVCMPNPEKPEKCFKFEWTRGHFIAFIFGMQTLLYVMTFTPYWQLWLDRHTRLSVFNAVSNSKLSLFLASFAHTSFFDFLRSCIMVATVVDVMFDDNVSDATILALWTVGTWIYLAAQLIYKKWSRSVAPEYLMHISVQGNSAAICALLGFHYCIDPDSKFDFAFALLPIPMKLGAPHLAGVMALLEVPNKGISCIIAYATSFMFGTYSFYLWTGF